MRLRFSRSTPLQASKLIVGLGNPGPEYAGTRHNVGFQTLDRFAAAHSIVVRTRRFHAVYGTGEIGSERVCLARPQTYYNLSGRAVAALLHALSLPIDALLVVCDDVNLPVGKLRIRKQGSAGGSGGLKSIVDSLGSDAFPRLRIGVGRPNGGGLVDHVLSKFDRADLPIVDRAIDTAVEAVELILAQGIEIAMSRYNALDLGGE